MERKEFLAAIANKKRVMCDDIEYIAIAYELSYSERNKKWIHTASLLDVKANYCVVNAPLADVKAKEDKQ